MATILTTENTLLQPSEVIDGGVTKASTLDNRFDPLLIAPYLKDAVERWWIPIACDELNDDMIEEATENGKLTISNYNENLGQVIPKFKTNQAYEDFWRLCLRQYLASATVLEALPFIGLQLGNAGLLANNAHYGENVGIEGLKWYGDSLQSLLERRKAGIIKYLCKNIDDFPLWGDCHCKGCGCEATVLSSSGCCSVCDKDDCGGVDVDKHLGVVIY